MRRSSETVGAGAVLLLVDHCCCILCSKGRESRSTRSRLTLEVEHVSDHVLSPSHPFILSLILYILLSYVELRNGVALLSTTY